MPRRVAKIIFLTAFAFLVIQFLPPTVVSGSSWVWVRNTVTGAYGKAVVGTGNAIYIARKLDFYRYNASDDSWTSLADPPNPDSGDAFKTGAALVWDFGDYIYALYGAATGDSRRWFYRYSISQDSWEELANTTADQGEGNAITWVEKENCIYATIGGEQRPTHLARYYPTTDTWSDAPANPSDGMGDGASLVWTGGDFLYALRGEDIEDTAICDFWRYSLIENTWTTMADIPASPHDGGGGGVGDGGSLLYVGFWRPDYMDYIYALSGNQAQPDGIPDNRTYCYSISTDTWECLPDLPFGVGYYVGCRLGYAEGHIYAWQGTPSTTIWTGGGDDLAKYVLPIDSNPPTIDIPSCIPSGDVEPDQPVQVSVSVIDTETGVKNATLFFTTDDGVNWESLAMNRNASTGLYEATIPGQAAETWVKFMIVVFDYAENDATRNGKDPYCAYRVVAEFPSIVLFVSFMPLALVTILIGKRKMKSGSF